jgi:hypothetical protein
MMALRSPPGGLALLVVFEPVLDARLHLRERKSYAMEMPTRLPG